MTAVLEARRVSRVCGSCSAEFDDLSTTKPRVYCYVCAPLPGARRLKSPPERSSLPGESFTLEHFLAWAEMLRLPGDEPVEVEVWEAAFIGDVFAGMREGWLREAWLIVPEGNGKSTLIAMLILYCVEFADEAAIPVAASARDQAKIIYDQGAGFIRRSPALRGRFESKPGLRELLFGDASRAKIFASDAGTGDGIIPFPLEVIDELHRHPTLELYRTWAGKLDKAGAILIVISTAGAPGSEFEEVREVMRQSATVAEVEGCFGRYVGATSVLHEYAVPEGGDVEDLELVAEANPSSRITVETLRAKRARPSWSLPHWRRLTCNVPTRSDAAAITEREWAAALAPKNRREIPAGEAIWLGLDLGWVHDTTAMVPLWASSFEFRLLGPATILEPPSDRSQLSADLVEHALRTIHARNPIHTVVMDMTKGEQLSQWIQDELGAEVVNRAQTNAFAVMDYDRFMEGLRERWLFHSGDAGLKGHALNAIARLLPGGDTRFDRPRPSRTVAPELQRRRVIDALTAATMVNTTVAGEFASAEPEPLVVFA